MKKQNKRVRRSRSTSARSARELIAETKPEPRTTEELLREIHRVELAIASTTRVASENKSRRGDSLPPPDRLRGPRPIGLTIAQARSKRARFMMHAAAFVTTFLLLAGAALGIYKMWLAVHGR